MSAGEAWGHVLAVLVVLAGALAAAVIVYLIVAVVKLTVDVGRGRTRLGNEEERTVFRSGKDDR